MNLRSLFGPLVSRPYLCTLALPALALNLLAALALASSHRPPEGAGSDHDVVAEVEIVTPQREAGEAGDRFYVVRVMRLVKGRPASRMLRVRFSDDVRPEGPALATWPGPAFHAGDRLFVVMRRDCPRRYHVRQLWLGSTHLAHQSSRAPHRHLPPLGDPTS